MDFDLDSNFRIVEIARNAFPNLVVIKTRVFLIQEVCFVFLLLRNLCGLYEFLPLCDLSRSD
jgi:hypothetical protein